MFHCCWRQIEFRIGFFSDPDTASTSVPQGVVPTGGTSNGKDEFIVLEAHSSQAGVIQSIVYVHEAHSAICPPSSTVPPRLPGMVTAGRDARLCLIAPGTRTDTAGYVVKVTQLASQALQLYLIGAPAGSI